MSVILGYVMKSVRGMSGRSGRDDKEEIGIDRVFKRWHTHLDGAMLNER